MATQQTPSIASTRSRLAKGTDVRRPRLRGSEDSRPGETLAAYLFLAPYLIVLLVFTLFVALYGIGLSLFKLDIGFTVPEFVGFHNYQVLFQQLSYASDSDFWVSMLNIVRFTFFVVIGETLLALFLAVVLNNTKFLRGLFRTILYLPAVTSSVAVSLIFLWLYAPQGAINYILSLIGISGPHWLEDPNFALPALMLLNIWTTAATFMIYFLAALQDIPRELIEAARPGKIHDGWWSIKLNSYTPP